MRAAVEFIRIQRLAMRASSARWRAAGPRFASRIAVDPAALMKLVIFGLTLSSSSGNGHATLWRGLIRALTRRNHDVVFFERDVPYYAEHRDLEALPGANLVLYREWAQVASRALTEARQADVAILSSYCPDATS